MSYMTYFNILSLYVDKFNVSVSSIYIFLQGILGYWPGSFFQLLHILIHAWLQDIFKLEVTMITTDHITIDHLCIHNSHHLKQKEIKPNINDTRVSYSLYLLNFFPLKLLCQNYFTPTAWFLFKNQ